jgi:hypothetical protein
MSISYSISFWSGDSIGVIADRVRRLCGLHLDPQHCGRSPMVETVTLVGDSMAIDVRDAGTVDREICKSDLSIDINRNLLVFPGVEFSTRSEAARQLVSIMCHMIDVERRDLVALFSGEKVLLLHRDGETLINCTAGFWNERTKQALTIPYSKATLPSI